MKRILISITAALLMIVIPAQARDYDKISDYALFLTDKMAYELNLSEEQYEAAYEINFDYLSEVMYDDYDDYDDLYGRAWRSRNRDFRIILLSSQYNMYKRLKYFYRPFHHSHGRIEISIYNYYPRRDYLYFGCPHFVITYRGGHGWRHYRSHSYYSGRPWHNNVSYGMRDGYRDGRRYYHNSTHHHSIHHDIHRDVRHRYDRNRDCHESFRNINNRSRVSSTRTTVNNRNSNFGKSRSTVDRERRLPDNRFSPSKARLDRNDSRKVTTERNKRRSSDDSRSNGERKGRFGGGR